MRARARQEAMRREAELVRAVPLCGGGRGARALSAPAALSHAHTFFFPRAHSHSLSSHPQLRAQMEGNAQRKAAAAQEEFRAFRAAQKFEEEYKAKGAALLQAEGGASMGYGGAGGGR